MTESNKILFQREKQGLLINFVVRLLALFIMILGHIIAHHSFEEVIRISILSCISMICIFYFIYLVKNDRYFKFVGYAGVFLDAILLVYLPYNWYLSVGFYEEVPAVYLYKTSLPIIALLIITISALAIRPLYPILLALIFDCIWIFFYKLITNDPRTIYTESFLETLFSEKILIEFYFTYIATITGVAFLLAFITHSFRKSIQQAVTLEVKTNQLSRYFSPGVLKEIQKDEHIFEAKKAKVIVLFIDIRGFTSMSESMEPTSVIQFLREYHAWVINVIYEFGGTIDKFLGDGLLVTFGTPIALADDPIRAIYCVKKLQKKLIEFNEERTYYQLSEVKQGIGMHYGEVVVGNIGSENRLEYTVIGDTVNLASRLELQCKDFGVDSIFSQEMVDVVHSISPKEFSFKELGEISIRGKSKTVKIFTFG